jgi:hypothetical protein
VGLESARDVFRRYKAIRRREREYVPEPPSSEFRIQNPESRRIA